MKIMIASDIHGSAFYCEKLVERFKESEAGRLVLLGDILYHGPRNALPEEYDPAKVAKLLNEIKDKLFCVRGNCDSEVDQMVLEFPIMSDYSMMLFENKTILFTHGHVWDVSGVPNMKKGDVVISGHTHVPGVWEYETYTAMNPGSVSIPKEDSRHSYMTFDDGIFEWFDMDGNKYKGYSIKG